jgi:hypothetical protein
MGLSTVPPGETPLALDGSPIDLPDEATLNLEKVTADIPNDSGESEQFQPVHPRAACLAALD